MAVIAGTWTAHPAKDVTLEVAFGADRTFSWTFIVQGQASGFTGTYSLDGRSLVMSRDGSSEKMAGTMKLNSSNSFNFKPAASEATDPGLDFVR
jgi:hypothetical protein